MSYQKELHFFIADESWGTWNRGIEWYSAQFNEGKAKRVQGEASPGYANDLFAEGAAARMKQVVPETKIIYALRNPIDRIRSHYTEELYGGRLPRDIPLNQILDAGPDGPSVLNRYYKEFVFTSLYGKQLSRYLHHYPLDHLHFVTVPDLDQNPSGEMRRIFNFLGVDEEFHPPNLYQRQNERAQKRLRVINPTALLQRMPLFSTLSRLAPEPIKTLYRRSVSISVDHAALIQISRRHLGELYTLFAADCRTFRGLTGIDLAERLDLENRANSNR